MTAKRGGVIIPDHTPAPLTPLIGSSSLPLVLLCLIVRIMMMRRGIIISHQYQRICADSVSEEGEA